MAKRYIIEDDRAIVDTKSLTQNGILTKIFVAEDPAEAIKICKEFNEKDQQIKELKEDNKQYKLIVESLKDENQKLKLRLKDLGVEYY